MRIVVPIKQVPETNAVRMDEQTGTMIREGVEAIVNPLDLYAIELAIRLRESQPLRHAQGRGGEIVAISMGPPKAAAAIKEAIAMGADSGVLISDKAFAGSDTWATSCVLAAAIKKLGGAGFQPVDLVICGERATDGDTGQVGPGIASFLDLPVVTYVSKVDEIADGRIRVHRLVEDGYEILESELPCVLTVVKEIASPRLPTLRGKQKARKTQLSVWGSGDLEVDEQRVGLNGSPTRVVKIFRPKVARKCRKITAGDEAATDEAAEKLVGFLRSKLLI